MYVCVCGGGGGGEGGGTVISGRTGESGVRGITLTISFTGACAQPNPMCSVKGQTVHPDRARRAVD